MRETIKKRKEEKKKKNIPPSPASICFGIDVQICTCDILTAFPARNGRKCFSPQKCIEYSKRNNLLFGRADPTLTLGHFKLWFSVSFWTSEGKWTWRGKFAGWFLWFFYFLVGHPRKAKCKFASQATEVVLCPAVPSTFPSAHARGSWHWSLPVPPGMCWFGAAVWIFCCSPGKSLSEHISTWQHNWTTPLCHRKCTMWISRAHTRKSCCCTRWIIIFCLFKYFFFLDQLLNEKEISSEFRKSNICQQRWTSQETSLSF